MNTNAEHLLLDNLNKMHLQTEHWEEVINFYEEELHFFNELVADKINMTTTEDLDHKEIYRNMDNILFKLSLELVKQIKDHRKELSKAIKSKDVSNHIGYNQAHLHLLEKMELLKQNIKRLKKTLFKFIKNHPFDYNFDDVINEI